METLKIGVILSHAGASQSAYCTIRNFNLMLQKQCNIAPIIFYENLSRPCLNTSFSVMSISEIFGFDGICIATSISSASRLLKTTGKLKKYLYLWDTEWLRVPAQQPFSFSEIYNIYSNPKLTIIPRCENHKVLMESLFNIKTTDVVEDFDLKQLFKVLGHAKQII